MTELAIPSSAWRPLLGVDPLKLSKARLQAHQAVQWLGRAARAYLSMRPDDGHTNLGWDNAIDGFVTHPTQDGTRLCLNVANLTLSLNDGKVALGFSLDGRNDRQARQWLGERLAARNLDANALDAPIPYTLPAPPLSQDASYDAAGFSDALSELAAWFANADIAVGHVREHLLDRQLDASAVRCWPHHFDLATSISFPARHNKTAYVGAGLSPGDGYYDEPYFYVSVYPRPDPVTLPVLPKVGHWHTHEFMAAVAPAHRILANPNEQAATDDFLKVAVEYAIKILL